MKFFFATVFSMIAVLFFSTGIISAELPVLNDSLDRKYKEFKSKLVLAERLEIDVSEYSSELKNLDYGAAFNSRKSYLDKLTVLTNDLAIKIYRTKEANRYTWNNFSNEIFSKIPDHTILTENSKNLKLFATLNRRGNLVGVSIQTSSGSNNIDKLVVTSLKSIKQFPATPLKDYQTVNFSLQYFEGEVVLTVFSPKDNKPICFSICKERCFSAEYR